RRNNFRSTLTAGKRPARSAPPGSGTFGSEKYHVVRSTRKRAGALRKAHAEIGGSAQARRATHSARRRQQLPPLRALPDFREGREGQQNPRHRRQRIHRSQPLLRRADGGSLPPGGGQGSQRKAR